MQGSAVWYRSKPKPVAITEAQFYPQKESHKKHLIKQSTISVRSLATENICITAENSISLNSVNSEKVTAYSVTNTFQAEQQIFVL